MTLAGSPGIRRSKKNRTRVIPNTTGIICASRRAIYWPITGSSAGADLPRGRDFAEDPLAHRMVEEALHALLDHVDIGYDVKVDERRVLHMDLLDPGVYVAPLGFVDHRAALLRQIDRLLVGPAGVIVLYLLRQDGVRDQLIRVDDIVGPAGGICLVLVVAIIVVDDCLLELLDVEVDADLAPHVFQRGRQLEGRLHAGLNLDRNLAAAGDASLLDQRLGLIQFE